VFAGSTGQQIMGLPAAANRDRQGNMEKRGGDMPRTFLAEKSSEDKDKKIGMFERAISRELSEMTSRQLSLQVSVSFKKHSDFLVRHGLAKCNTVLDVGTGNGDFCCRLAELYPNIQFTGIDLKGDLIERAIQLSHDRGITNTNWVIGDISTHQLGKSESSFDGILLRYTDIHMPTTVPTLVE
jgi:ubiquinone/menaquinone biosynthesis C-methylase UbiE